MLRESSKTWTLRLMTTNTVLRCICHMSGKSSKGRSLTGLALRSHLSMVHARQVGHRHCPYSSRSDQFQQRSPDRRPLRPISCTGRQLLRYIERLLSLVCCWFVIKYSPLTIPSGFLGARASNTRFTTPSRLQPPHPLSDCQKPIHLHRRWSRTPFTPRYRP